MQTPEASPSDVDRVHAVNVTGLFSACTEDKFDRVTRLSLQIFGVKLALVAFVDGDNVWLKSRQGQVDFYGLPRKETFCTRTVEQSDIFEVLDARIDLQFQNNPLVTGPTGIRYYAGAPIKLSNGHRIGALCLLHDEPRAPLNTAQRQSLRDLADCVAQAIGDVNLHEQGLALRSAQQLGEVISRAQRVFIQETDRDLAFDTLLNDVLALTNSAYGFVSDVLYQEDGQPYMKTHAITNISWDESSGAYYDAQAPNGMVFSNLKSLFGAAMTTGEVVIANNPRFDPRSGGLPPGHPPLHAFLGIPIHHGGEMIALLGLANRPGGYNQALVDFLQPLRQSIGHLVSATRVLDAHERVQVELARLSRVASETTNSVIITDREGRIEWINEGFTRLSGYVLSEVKGRRPGDVFQCEQTDPQTIAFMHESLAQGDAFTVDVLNVRKDQQPYWVRLNCNPLRAHSGAYQGAIAIGSDITREKSDADRIRHSEQRLSAVIEGASIATWEWHIPSGVTEFNERWAQTLGYTLAELAPHDIEGWRQLMHPDDVLVSQAQLQAHFDKILDDYDLECRMRHKEGHWVWVKIRGSVTTWTDDGKPCQMFGTQVDISARQQAKIALQEQVHYTQAVLDNIVDGLITIDTQGIIVSFNPAAEKIFGYHSTEVVGCNVNMLMPAALREVHDSYLQGHKEFGKSRVYGVTRELHGQHKTGHTIPLEIAVSEITREGQTLFVGLVRDITLRKAAEQEIERLAFYDPLTKLPNRRLLLDRLERAMSAGKRTKEYSALLFIDLDNFKNLNDTAGHAVGDQLLQQVGQRLRHLLRESDTIARLGGDEFVVMLEGLDPDADTAAAYTESVVEKIQHALSQNYHLSDRHYQNTPSIGVTMFMGHEHSLQDLLKQADLAMYQAKNAGRNTHRFFDPQMQSKLMVRTQMESDLRAAIADNQFQLYLQPQVDAQGRTTGAEALLRWFHPQRGLVPPNLFIPVAEEMGLIIQIGQWVRESACQVLVAWARQAQTADYTLAINISVIEFRQADFVDQVQRTLTQTGARPDRLKLELTESMLISNLDDIIDKMTTLKALGVSFSLDDFGTGYSSLSYLKRLPLDQLKIDQSFVREICTNTNDAAIARTIVALSLSMGMAVIAEGVETSSQRAALAEMGCSAYQGYLFGKPAPLTEWPSQQCEPALI